MNKIHGKLSIKKILILLFFGTIANNGWGASNKSSYSFYKRIQLNNNNNAIAQSTLPHNNQAYQN